MKKNNVKNKKNQRVEKADFRVTSAEKKKLVKEADKLGMTLSDYDKEPREMLLFFYYPSLEYLSYLTEVDGLELYDEITCADLFGGSEPRERVMVFRLQIK